MLTLAAVAGAGDIPKTAVTDTPSGPTCCAQITAYVETLNGVARPSYQLGDARQLMLPDALSGVSAAGRR
jgi:hypothetical protein